MYVYGHGAAGSANGLYQLISAWNNYGNLATTNTADWNPTEWTEGAQFVLYRDVALPAGQAILLQVSPNALGLALLNGLQLVGKPLPAGDADGDGLSDAEELQRGTNPYAVSTTGDGVSDFVKVRQGRNPLAAASLDTAGALGFAVFTPLR